MRYLLFDLDGTLTDPKEGITRCFQYALEAYGIHEEDLDALAWVIGPPLADSFMEGYGFPREKALEAVEKYRERYAPLGWKENVPYPGMKEALAELKEAGLVLAVATSKPEDMAVRILEHFGLAEYFAVIGGATRDLSRVNKVDVLEYVLERLGNPGRGECLMVGDRKFDVEGAKKAGFACLGVLYGYGSEEELREAGAAALAATVEEMKEYCLKVIGQAPGDGFQIYSRNF